MVEVASIVRMPEVLANATDAVIATWAAPEGTAVAVGDLLAEIETDKAVVELTAEEDGVLARHLAAAGDRVDVGAPIALLLASADEQVDLAALLGRDADLASQAENPTDDDGAVARAAAAGGAVPAVGASAADAAPAPATPSAPGTAGGPAGRGEAPRRQFVSPLARRRAREAGVSLDGVVGTGPGGRVVRRDVDRLVAAASAAAAVPAAARGTATSAAPASPSAAPGPVAAPAAGGRVEPHSAMRRAIARRLTESKATVPHFYLTAECRVDALLALRREINASGSVRVSVNDLVLRATAVAFREVPEGNVLWGEDGLHRFDAVDVAVAVATDGGLVTPVVRGVEGLTVGALARTVADLAARAREGRLRQHELEGGTLTVSNLGMYGTREFAAILNPPQALILAVGAAVEQAVVVDGTLTVGTVMRCTLSVDHRAVDGALAARWLTAFQGALEHPLTLLV